MKIYFKDEGSHPYTTMYKIGDDLRQDSLITCVFQLMESIWLDAGLDLRMRTFKVFPTERNKGFIELVPVRVLYFFQRWSNFKGAYTSLRLLFFHLFRLH